jgi:hypothetical protein
MFTPRLPRVRTVQPPKAVPQKSLFMVGGFMAFFVRADQQREDRR